MIVIAGSPVAELGPDGMHRAEGLGVRVARNLIRQGEQVELIGRIGADREGDELTLSLARDGIGHVALMRDAAQITPIGSSARGIELDYGDVQLGLRYLTNFTAVLLLGPTSRTFVQSVADEAAYCGAHLIVVGEEFKGQGEGSRSDSGSLGTPTPLHQVAPPLFVPHPQVESAEFEAVLTALLMASEGGATKE